MVYCGNNVSRETYKRRKIMVQLLKTEIFLKEDNFLKINEITARIIDRVGNPTKIIPARTGGYVKTGNSIIALYNGRHGIGITKFHNNPISTRYCTKCYYIFDIEYESLKKIIEKQLYIKIDEAGEKRWQ